MIIDPDGHDEIMADEPSKCPMCGRPAVVYIVMWDEHRCENGHMWDGPLNGGPPIHESERRG